MGRKLRKPYSWQEFENICLKVLEYEYGKAQLYGRLGQNQYGIDIYSYSIPFEGKYIVAQCKDKKNKNELINEIKNDLVKAKDLPFVYSEFIIMTTLDLDTYVIDEVNKLRCKYKKDFNVVVLFWNEISEKILNNYDLLYMYDKEYINKKYWFTKNEVYATTKKYAKSLLERLDDLNLSEIYKGSTDLDITNNDFYSYLYVKQKLIDYESMLEYEKKIEEEQFNGLSSRDDGMFDSPSYYKNKVIRFSLDYLTRINNNILILGNPGVGKTTMVKNYLYNLSKDIICRESASDDTITIPVLIELRNYGEDVIQSTIDKIIEFSIKSHTNLDTMTCEEILHILEVEYEYVKTLIIIDGLDEITDSKLRKIFSYRIQNYSQKADKIKIIVTSRILGYRYMPFEFSDFKVVLLDKLSLYEKSLFISNWINYLSSNENEMNEGIVKLMKGVNEKLYLTKLTDSPLLLMLLILIYNSIKRLPLTIDEFFEKSIELLLVNWKEDVYDVIEPELAIPALSYLAFEMNELSILRISYEMVISILEEWKIRYNEAVNLDVLINQIEYRTGIFINVGKVRERNSKKKKTIWQFMHASIQDYLTGVALSSNTFSEYSSDFSLKVYIEKLLNDIRVIENINFETNRKEISIDMPKVLQYSLKYYILIIDDMSANEVVSIMLNKIKTLGEKEQIIGLSIVFECLSYRPNLLYTNTINNVIDFYIEFLSIANKYKGTGLEDSLKIISFRLLSSKWKKEFLLRINNILDKLHEGSSCLFEGLNSLNLSNISSFFGDNSTSFLEKRTILSFVNIYLMSVIEIESKWIEIEEFILSNIRSGALIKKLYSLQLFERIVNHYSFIRFEGTLNFDNIEKCIVESVSDYNDFSLNLFLICADISKTLNKKSFSNEIYNLYLDYEIISIEDILQEGGFYILNSYIYNYFVNYYNNNSPDKKINKEFVGFCLRNKLYNHIEKFPLKLEFNYYYSAQDTILKNIYFIKMLNCNTKDLDLNLKFYIKYCTGDELNLIFDEFRSIINDDGEFFTGYIIPNLLCRESFVKYVYCNFINNNNIYIRLRTELFLLSCTDEKKWFDSEYVIKKFIVDSRSMEEQEILSYLSDIRYDIKMDLLEKYVYTDIEEDFYLLLRCFKRSDKSDKIVARIIDNESLPYDSKRISSIVRLLAYLSINNELKYVSEQWIKSILYDSIEFLDFNINKIDYARISTICNIIYIYMVRKSTEIIDDLISDEKVLSCKPIIVALLLYFSEIKHPSGYDFITRYLNSKDCKVRLFSIFGMIRLGFSDYIIGEEFLKHNNIGIRMNAVEALYITRLIKRKQLNHRQIMCLLYDVLPSEIGESDFDFCVNDQEYVYLYEGPLFSNTRFDPIVPLTKFQIMQVAYELNKGIREVYEKYRELSQIYMFTFDDDIDEQIEELKLFDFKKEKMILKRRIIEFGKEKYYN